MNKKVTGDCYKFIPERVQIHLCIQFQEWCKYLLTVTPWGTNFWKYWMVLSHIFNVTYNYVSGIKYMLDRVVIESQGSKSMRRIKVKGPVSKIFKLYRWFRIKNTPKLIIGRHTPSNIFNQVFQILEISESILKFNIEFYSHPYLKLSS